MNIAMRNQAHWNIAQCQADAARHGEPGEDRSP